MQAALGRALKLLAISAAGLLLGLLASRVLASVVYQTTPRDPLVLAGVVLTMLLVALLATWIPAQRAMSLDPFDTGARGVIGSPVILQAITTMATLDCQVYRVNESDCLRTAAPRGDPSARVMINRRYHSPTGRN